MNREHLADQLAQLSRRPPDLDPRVEAEHLATLAETELDAFLDPYKDFRVEGAGGSGIVLSAVFTPFNSRRALKFPRERLYRGSTPEALSEDVDPELHALAKISHENITRLYDSFALKSGPGHVMITEYVDDPKPLDRFAQLLCCSEGCRLDETRRSIAVRQLAGIIYEVVDGLGYMHHTANLLHFDVKPDNVLVSSIGKPFITDLGFARDLTKYKPGTLVDIGFTWKYAHPFLTDPDHGARVSQNPAKAKNQVPAEHLHPRLDIFAFGRTIQETLYVLEDVYGETIHSDYTFNYLHLVACLCLDSKNAPNASAARMDFVSDQALGMPIALFQAKPFRDFRTVRLALQRLLGRRRLEDDLPELDRWSSATLNVSDIGITTLTPRVKALVEHPGVQRLSGELQLGMLDTIFPTATHTRLQHSLGVYHAVCDYLTALYYDPENPTFRVFFDVARCEKALLSALLHDIGQTTFGHELEEVDETEFSHEEIGKAILLVAQWKDSAGRTIANLINGSGPENWKTTVEDIHELIAGESTDLFDGILHDILNGQLDADKLDYLIRDSVEARVTYGHGIDSQRLLRSLTTVAVTVGRRPALKLAVKRKGAASAEAFALARYQLYQSLYWHHTFRAIKAMLLSAASHTFASLKEAADRELFDRHALRDGYLRHVVGVEATTEEPVDGSISSRSKRSGKSLKAVIEERTAAPGPPPIGKYSQDPTISFLWRLSMGKERLLIRDLIERRYYKRLIEIPLSDFTEEGWLRLPELLKNEGRISLQERIRSVLANSLNSAIQDRSKERSSLHADDLLRRSQEISSMRHPFLVDLPLRGWTATGDVPLFVSDYKRRHFRAGAGEQGSIEAASLWSEHLGPMMRQIAFFRVYCEPDLHSIVRTVLEPEDVHAAIFQVLPWARKKS